MFKYFSNKASIFDENVLFNFDRYCPIITNTHSQTEARQRFLEAGLSEIQASTPKSGISAEGIEK
jgi:hypothetical protein